MIVILQRVLRAAVTVEDRVTGSIGNGALILLGVEEGDGEDDAATISAKIAALRFFPGRTPMDRTLAEVAGSCLVVSQFTLAAALGKGNRPAFTRAAAPERAEQLYQDVVTRLRGTGLPVATGQFGAAMAVESVNDGPVTFVLRVRGGKVLELAGRPQQ